MLTIDDARGGASDRAKLPVLQDAIDAAGRAVETDRRSDRAALRTAAFGAPDRAAGKAVFVVALVADEAIAAHLAGRVDGWKTEKRPIVRSIDRREQHATPRHAYGGRAG